jgi:hypothetical protein
VPAAYKQYAEFVDERLNSYNAVHTTLSPDQDIYIDPLDLISFWRFDLVAKCLYAKHYCMGVRSKWARTLYAEHLKVWGNLQEWDGSRSSLDEYLRSFENTIHSMHQQGFDTAQSRIRIDNRMFPCEGAHRIAAALVTGNKVACYYSDNNRLNPAAQATAIFFKCFDKYVPGGLASHYLDAMALHYTELKPQTRIFIAFGDIQHKKEELKALIRAHGNIIYMRACKLTERGLTNLLLHHSIDDLQLRTTIESYKQTVLSSFHELTIFLFEPRSSSSFASLMSFLPSVHEFIYPASSYENMLELGQTFFVPNSLFMMNTCIFDQKNILERKIAALKAWCADNNLDSNNFCIHLKNHPRIIARSYNPSLPIIYFDDPLPAYDPHILNFTHDGLKKRIRDELLFNPTYHFYFHGIKCSMDYSIDQRPGNPDINQQALSAAQKKKSKRLNAKR